MKFIWLSILVSTALVSVSAYANDELEGICAKPKTAASCIVKNSTPHEISQLGWLLEGSWNDYGDDIVLKMSAGAVAIVSNFDGPNNCLFTENTSVYAYYSDSAIQDEPVATISFDSNDGCTIELN